MSLRRRDACLMSLMLPVLPVRGQDRAVLRIGWSDYPPFQHKAPSGAPQGLDVELLELMAQAAGERLQWLRRPWARQMQDVARGEQDLVPSATHAQDRLAFGDFTQPYRQERLALFTMPGGAPAPRKLSELKGRAVKVGFIRGVIFPASVRRDLEDPELAKLMVPLYANDLTLSALRARRVDYVIDEPATLLHRAARIPGDTPEVALELAQGPVHVFVGRHLLEQRPELMQRLNHGLQRARQQPEWAQALARYPGV